jgi:glutamine amidotransferase
MVAIIDYGVGNLFSLKSSFAAIGEEATVSADPSVLRAADRLILPGVGAFGDAAKKLRESGLDKVLLEEVEKGKPLMGICLGMQMLFEKSFEYGEYEGLGLIKGEIRPISSVIPEELPIPQIGWNALHIENPNALTADLTEGEYVYFVHSFMAKPTNRADLACTTDYGTEVPAMVARGNLFGCQFHPEKSGPVGLSMLRNFAKLTEGNA